MGEAVMLTLPSSTLIDHNWQVWHVTVQKISPAALSSGDDTTNLHWGNHEGAGAADDRDCAYMFDTPVRRVVTVIDGTCSETTGKSVMIVVISL
jgi:hypothetical protein